MSCRDSSELQRERGIRHQRWFDVKLSVTEAKNMRASQCRLLENGTKEEIRNMAMWRILAYRYKLQVAETGKGKELMLGERFICARMMSSGVDL